MRERRKRPDPDERFKIEADDPEDALRRLLGTGVPVDNDDEEATETEAL